MTTNNTSVLDASRLHHIKGQALSIKCQMPQFAVSRPSRVDSLGVEPLWAEAHKVPVGAGLIFFERKTSLYHLGVKVSQTSMLVYASYAPGSDTLIYRRTKKGGLDQSVFVLEFKKRANVWPLALDLSLVLPVRSATLAAQESTEVSAADTSMTSPTAESPEAPSVELATKKSPKASSGKKTKK